MCAAALLKNGRSGVPFDALIGGAALLGTIVLFAVLPWPRNTITYTSRGGTTVTSTMSRYQHDEAVAWTLATLLPVAHEVYRCIRRRGR